MAMFFMTFGPVKVPLESATGNTMRRETPPDIRVYPPCAYVTSPHMQYAGRPPGVWPDGTAIPPLGTPPRRPSLSTHAAWA